MLTTIKILIMALNIYAANYVVEDGREFQTFTYALNEATCSHSVDESRKHDGYYADMTAECSAYCAQSTFWLSDSEASENIGARDGFCSRVNDLTEQRRL